MDLKAIVSIIKYMAQKLFWNDFFIGNYAIDYLTVDIFNKIFVLEIFRLFYDRMVIKRPSYVFK